MADFQFNRDAENEADAISGKLGIELAKMTGDWEVAMAAARTLLAIVSASAGVKTFVTEITVAGGDTYTIASLLGRHAARILTDEEYEAGAWPDHAVSIDATSDTQDGDDGVWNTMKIADESMGSLLVRANTLGVDQHIGVASALTMMVAQNLAMDISMNSVEGGVDGIDKYLAVFTSGVKELIPPLLEIGEQAMTAKGGVN